MSNTVAPTPWFIWKIFGKLALLSIILWPKTLLVGLLGSCILRVLNATLRWEVVGLEGEKRYWPAGEPLILAFWHDQQLLMPWIYRNGRKRGLTRPMAVLTSQHQDGRLVASIMHFLGIHTVAGSSSKRGLGAMLELIKKLKSGSHVAITPDGPRGPRHTLKGGVIRIAQRSGAKIYPAAIWSRSKWQFRSWDKMTLPKPFSKVVLVMGEPIAVPAELGVEEIKHYTGLVQEGLDNATKKAQNHTRLKGY